MKSAAKAWHGPKTIDKTHFIYSLGAAQAELALWYWFLAELGTDFLANWMTLIYEEQRCDLPSAGHAQFGAGTHAQFAPGPYGVDIFGTTSKPCFFVGGNVISVASGCDVSISYELNWQPFLGLPANNGAVTSWIQQVGGPAFNVVTGNGGENGQKQVTGGSLRPEPNLSGGPRQYTINWSLSKGLMHAPTGNVYITASGRKVDIFPAGCTPRRTS